MQQNIHKLFKEINELAKYAKLYLWRYKNPRSSLSGVHFRGNKFGLELLIANLQLMSSGLITHKTFDIQKADISITSIVGIDNTFSCPFEKLTIHYNDSIDYDCEMISNYPDRKLEIKIGKMFYLENVIDRLKAVRFKNDGDFAFSSDYKNNLNIIGSLWVWWLIK